MAIQYQYDLEAHLDDILTLLLHSCKLYSIIAFAFLTSSATETEKTGEMKIAAIENDVIDKLFTLSL